MAQGNQKKLTRVQNLIRKSFLDELKHTNFYNIHVKDLLEKDNISRASFYMYYQNKYELLDSIEQELIAGLRDVFETVRASSGGKRLTLNDSNAIQLYSAYFHYMEKNAELFKLLLGPNGDGIFLQKLTDVIIREQTITRKEWGVDKVIHEKYTDQLTILLSYGYVGIFLNWINTPEAKRLPAEEMGKMFAHFFSSLSTDHFENLKQ